MTTTISRKALSSFSSFSSAFGQDQTPFSAFIQQPFGSVIDLSTQARRKLQAYSSDSRKVLTDTIARQLENQLSNAQHSNLDLLREETTMTITTGHQLTLFGGPLFLLYKVLHVVKLARSFNESQTEFKAVPVFWLASEDHDFEEIQSAQLFNKNLTWETAQKGTVGRFGMEKYNLVLDELKAFFTTKEACELLELVKDLPNADYASHYQQLMNRLFADFGVLVIQPDDHALKQLFIPVLQREITEQPSLKAVQETNEQLQKAGWSPQAQARACNLFLLDAIGRHRIDPSANGFTVDGKTYTKDELLALVEQQPESFSPNVILRPVYQETILPNLAYIGGGGEMAYWIQLKGVFEAHKVLFPLIQQRNSLLLVDGATAKRIEKTGWELSRFFEPKEQLRKAYLLEHDADQLNMEAIQSQFQALRLGMITKAKEIDVSLESFAEAETVRMSKQLEVYEQRLLKQIKQQHEQALKAIDGVCDRFLPGNVLQERALHWLNFAPSGDYSGLLTAIEAAIDPFQSDLIVVELKN
ncbi:MAG: bacillithiol biosynthesis cysteine-adding enzyme BshC [Bacteroidota bacterium]